MVFDGAMEMHRHPEVGSQPQEQGTGTEGELQTLFSCAECVLKGIKSHALIVGHEQVTLLQT